MASWREMVAGDIAGVMRVHDQIHSALPERVEVFRERLSLFPGGCWALADGQDICGYAISLPIRHGQPPALNSLLGQIAPDADQYYVHDVAILPKSRGGSLASIGINNILAVAKDYPSTCLISVYGTASFWGRFGFVAVPIDEALSSKLRGYGHDATYLVRQRDP